MSFLHNAFYTLKWIQNRYGGYPVRLVADTLKGFLAFHVFWKYGNSIEPTQGASMLPTIEVMGDHVLISKQYRRGRGIKVGDIIGFDSVHMLDEVVIKRVLGMPGDYVMRDTPGSMSNAMLQVIFIPCVMQTY
jgi:inner membrane protease subunit 1